MTDPRGRLLLLLGLGVWTVLVDRPLSLALLAGLGLVAFVAGVDGRWRWRGLAIAGAVVWSTVVSQGLFYAELPRTPWLRVGPLVFWEEGLRWGAIQSLRLLAVSFAGVALAVTTAPDRLFAGLLWLRVPYGIAFLAVMALRFVPETGRELLIVREARARRGRPVWRRSPWAWLRLELALLRPVVARSMRRSRRLAESLDARGFDPLRSRRLRDPLRFSSVELVVLGGVALLTVLMLSVQGAHWAYTLEVFYDPRLRPVYALARGWL